VLLACFDRNDELGFVSHRRRRRIDDGDGAGARGASRWTSRESRGGENDSMDRIGGGERSHRRLRRAPRSPNPSNLANQYLRLEPSYRQMPPRRTPHFRTTVNTSCTLCLLAASSFTKLRGRRWVVAHDGRRFTS
jgi:hypothetical protein